MRESTAERIAAALDSIANALERQNHLMVALILRGGSPHRIEDVAAFARVVTQLERVL